MDPSPFVVKVDLFLRITKLDYRIKCGANYLKKSPKGKLPFITDNEETVGDSSFILDYLNKKHSLDVDHFLTDEERATAYLFTKSLEENLYWCVVSSRWVDDKTWPIAKAAFFESIPFPLNTFIPSLIRRGVIKNLNGQGIGRHSQEEVLSITDKSLQALSDFLGDKKYFFGNKVSTFDATAYSMLCQLYIVNYVSEFGELAKKYDNLAQYCERIKNEFY